jgi:cyclomaltodextrinase / maltogenic alpha-amylase / neopullulanase
MFPRQLFRPILLCLLIVSGSAHATGMYANDADRALAGTFAAREKDWRNGAIVYQVLVDRFAPSTRLAEKKSLNLYAAPKVLREWSETPKRGTYVESIKLWSHEIDFWGGDLQSLTTKLDYIESLGADVLYLNPIHLAYTNHKYDALDYMKVSPEFGTREDVKALAQNVHQRKMKLVLDGVFNHMGHNSDKFKEASADPKSSYRDWFYFGKEFAGGARSWALAQSLPELNLENPRVREHIFGGTDSVVRSYLRDGVDGWRLDVAPDIGFTFLGELTRAAHAQKPGSLIVGEIANYPKEWFPSVDAVMNFNAREIVLQTAAGKIDAATAGRMIARIIDDAGIEPILKSWMMLDNHDTARIATTLPDARQRQLAQVLQFTLPGSPNLYYGSEVGMTGGEDPEMRAPMRWDLVKDGNAELKWTRKLINLRKQHRGLRIGNFRLVTTNQLLAFERYTDRVEDSVFVIANPGTKEVTETVLLANSKLMNGGAMIDVLGTVTKPIFMNASLITVSIPSSGYVILKPDVKGSGGYTSYKRVQ